MKQKVNLKNTQSYTMSHSNQDTIQTISDKLTSLLPVFPREYIIVCIGTDRSTGDALGPLTGTYLKQLNLKHMDVYGTLHHPVHAQNLAHYISTFNDEYKRPFIIAIDACLGKSTSIGNITLGTGPLSPGAALNKKLPVIGDVHLTAVVNVSGFMEYAVLQNTRLSIVTDMATTIASILSKVDHQLSFTQRLAATISPEFKTKNALNMGINKEHYSN